MKKLYSAAVKDGDTTVFIIYQEYNTKADFIYDLRRNGYKVNPAKVKPARVFDYIINHTNCNPWDWKLTDEGKKVFPDAAKGLWLEKQKPAKERGL